MLLVRMGNKKNNRWMSGRRRRRRKTNLKASGLSMGSIVGRYTFLYTSLRGGGEKREEWKKMKREREREREREVVT